MNGDTVLCVIHHMSLTTDVHVAVCIEHTFPSATGPSASPLRGPVGYTRFGVNIYGPNEAGFGGQGFPAPCEDGSGTCAGGIDVPTCEESLKDICAETGSTVVYSLMLDTCGGHAMPYHYHGDDSCDYDHTAAGHSPLIGFGLDGVGIYGLYESNPTTPALDTCNGHVGEVPADDEFGVPAGTRMYHYHVTSTAPYTLGCYGNPGSKSEPIDRDTCKNFYDTCDNGEFAAISIDGSSYCYDLDCPCFYPSDGKLGRNSDDTSCLEMTISV